MANAASCILLLLMALNYAVQGAEAQDGEWENEEGIGELVRRKSEECSQMYQNVTVPGIDPDFHCPPIFDGVLCWPPTAPENQAELRCPPYIDFYQTTPVHKACLSDGTWAIQDLAEVYGGQGECRCVHCSIISIFSNLGYALSFTTCAIAFIIFMCCRSLRCTRNFLHWHLITSFMLKYVIFFIQPAVVGSLSVHFKRIVVFLLYYFEETNYFWMFVEGLYLHTLVVFALKIDADKISFWVYCIIGWGLPLVFVGVWAIVSIVLYPEGDFITPIENATIVPEYACIIGPILLVLVINCFFLLNIVRLLMSKLRMHGNRSSDIKHYRRAARATLVLVVLLGVSYILMICQPLLMMNLPAIGNLVFNYVNALLSGTQGLAVAVIYVFLNTEVRTVLRRKYRRQFGNSNHWLFRKRAKPRASSYSKYDDHTCMSTMRSVGHNDTVVDCYQDDDQGHRGHHQGNKVGGGTDPLANGDATARRGGGSQEKVEIEVVRSNGNVAQWDRTEDSKGAEEAEPLLDTDGNPPNKPSSATIVISEATPVHTTSEGEVLDSDDKNAINQPD